MSLWSNELRVESSAELRELLGSAVGVYEIADDHFGFTLADPMLQGSAKRGASWDPNDDVVRIGIDFDRASSDERDIQARMQAEFFGPIVTHVDVVRAELDHEDYWHVLRREAGSIVVTDRAEAVDHVLTLALCAWFDERGVRYTRADLGQP